MQNVYEIDHKFSLQRQQTHKSTVHSTAPLDHREAMRLQQEESERMNARRAAAQASRAAKEERIMAGIPSGWDNLTQQEKNARIMAFMYVDSLRFIVYSSF
jgi:uncharacterized small protein (DUF1192 family)